MIDTKRMQEKLIGLGARTDASLSAYAETAAHKMRDHAKGNHPWENRSFAAEERLYGDSESVPYGFLLQLGHGVEYGVYLELAHDKNYAIIMPTINLMAPEIIRGMEGLMEKINVAD